MARRARMEAEMQMERVCILVGVSKHTACNWQTHCLFGASEGRRSRDWEMVDRRRRVAAVATGGGGVHKYSGQAARKQRAQAKWKDVLAHRAARGAVATAGDMRYAHHIRWKRVRSGNRSRATKM